jgi:hypothetical protein
MVEVGVAEAFEFFERFEFGSNEREDGLLLVSQKDGGGLGDGEEVDNGQLEEIEVLHFVYLNPTVASEVGVVEGEKVCFLKEILEVKEVVGLFVFGIEFGYLCFALPVRVVELVEEFGVDNEFVGYASSLLTEGVLKVDDVGGVAGMVFGGVEVCQMGDDAFGVEVVDYSTVLRNFLLVEKVVGAKAMDVAHEEVRGYGVVGVETDTLTHSTAGTVGEG